MGKPASTVVGPGESWRSVEGTCGGPEAGDRGLGRPGPSVEGRAGLTLISEALSGGCLGRHLLLVSVSEPLGSEIHRAGARAGGGDLRNRSRLQDEPGRPTQHEATSVAPVHAQGTASHRGGPPPSGGCLGKQQAPPPRGAARQGGASPPPRGTGRARHAGAGGVGTGGNGEP